nr:unnamed protein product [Callosobruchus analis]
MTGKQKDELGFSVLAQVLPDILTRLTDPEAQFRLYVAVGTLIKTAQLHEAAVKAKLTENSNFLTTMQMHSFSGRNELENKRMNCVKQLSAIGLYIFSGNRPRYLIYLKKKNSGYFMKVMALEGNKCRYNKMSGDHHRKVRFYKLSLPTKMMDSHLPMHMIKLIIDIESKLTPHSAMYPTTPASIEMMLRATQKEHSIFGMKMKETSIIMLAPMIMFWMDSGRTNSNYNKTLLRCHINQVPSSAPNSTSNLSKARLANSRTTSHYGEDQQMPPAGAQTTGASSSTCYTSEETTSSIIIQQKLSWTDHMLLVTKQVQHAKRKTWQKKLSIAIQFFSGISFALLNCYIQYHAQNTFTRIKESGHALAYRTSTYLEISKVGFLGNYSDYGYISRSLYIFIMFR